MTKIFIKLKHPVVVVFDAEVVHLLHDHILGQILAQMYGRDFRS